ncbi:MAG: hypothetical protein ABEI99_02560 [Halobaculum sp.]
MNSLLLASGSGTALPMLATGGVVLLASLAITAAWLWKLYQ